MNDASTPNGVSRQINAVTATDPLSVCVIGLGYIGLPTASILASRGHHVRGVDIRPGVCETINRGEVHIEEPRLDQLVRRVVQQGNFSASPEPGPADVFVVCVPTPVTADLRPDMSCVEQACRTIRPHIRPGNLIILESTSPPGTTGGTVVRHALPSDLTVGKNVFVAYCPERVLPGRILTEVIHNHRVVGGVTPSCTDRAKRFYESFVRGNVLVTDAVTAEFVKLAENSFRDVNIAFANELSMLAEQFDADPFEIIRLANHHPRVDILTPGPGVGGHCIAVDPWFLVDAMPHRTPLIRAAREVNDYKLLHIVQRINQLSRDSNIQTIGCLGLTYKADVDDLRESPSLEIVRRLRTHAAAEVIVCDPHVQTGQFTEFPLASLDETLQRSQLLVLLTDHSQFRAIPPEALSHKMVIDTRGVWQEHLRQATLPMVARERLPAAA